MSRNVRIIGLSGTNGAGKDAVGLLLAQRHNYLFISVTDLLRQELHVRNLPPDRKYMRALSKEWREQYGLSVLVDRAYQSYQAVEAQYAGVVMSSLRNPYEADRVHELGGTVVWVDADPRIRYQRLQSAQRQGREGDDNKTFQEFMADEQAEMSNSGDAAALNMSAVRDKTDVIITNNSAELSILESAIVQSLGL
jgi:shikimate kinase